jgi:hypothetical protein
VNVDYSLNFLDEFGFKAGHQGFTDLDVPAGGARTIRVIWLSSFDSILRYNRVVSAEVLIWRWEGGEYLPYPLWESLTK